MKDTTYRSIAYATMIVFIVGIGFVDWVTGYELQFFVFYYIPIVVVAWIGGARPAYFFAVLSTIMWLLVDQIGGRPHPSLVYILWETSIYLVAYLIMGYSVARFRRDHEAQKEAQAHLEEKVEARTQELKDAQSKLVMQARMASVGQLAAGIAHEINNPLNFVSINFGTLKNDIEIFRDMVIAYRDLLNRLPGVTDVKGEIEKIRCQEREIQLDFVLEHIDRLFAESRGGMRRVIEIVNSMRDFSRMDSLGRFAPLNINKAVKDALVIAKNSYKYRAEVHERLGKVPEITCVPDMINRVLLNLIVNAAQAIEEKAPGEALGRITVSTCADSDNVYCEVTDTGPGIPAEIQEKIFEPFFTTKGSGKGTGLGLSISYDIIVNKHGGDLSVTSKVGEGAKFLVCLPIHPDRCAKAHPDAAATKEGTT